MREDKVLAQGDVVYCALFSDHLGNPGRLKHCHTGLRVVNSEREREGERRSN